MQVAWFGFPRHLICLPFFILLRCVEFHPFYRLPVFVVVFVVVSFCLSWIPLVWLCFVCVFYDMYWARASPRHGKCVLFLHYYYVLSFFRFGLPCCWWFVCLCCCSLLFGAACVVSFCFVIATHCICLVLCFRGMVRLSFFFYIIIVIK